MRLYAPFFMAIILPSLFMLPVFQTTATAASLSPFITELNWGGSEKSAADEWLRIYNPTDQSLDLSGWILTGSATKGSALSLAEGTILPPHEDLLIANYANDHENSVLTEEPDLVTASLSLPNSNGDILLADKNGTVLDEVHYKTPPAGSTEPHLSMTRLSPDTDWIDGPWNTEALQNLYGMSESETNESLNDSENMSSVSETVVNVEPSLVEPTPVQPVSSDPLAMTPFTQLTPEQQYAACEAHFAAWLLTQESTDSSILEEEIEESEETLEEAEESDTETVKANEDETENLETVDSNEENVSEDLSIQGVQEASNEEDSEQNSTEEVSENTNSEITISETEENETATTVESEENPSPESTTEESPLEADETLEEATILPLIINEILPAPSDGDEWVEIYNPHDETVNLEGWILKDASGKQTALEGEVLAHEFFLIFNPSGNLNNTGDQVQLIAPNKSIIDAMSYGTEELPAPKKDVSLSKTSDGTWEATVATPGTENIFESNEEMALEDVNETTNEDTLDLSLSANTEEDSATIESETSTTENTASTQPEDSASSTDEDTVYTITAIAEPNLTQNTSTQTQTTTTQQDDGQLTLTGVITALPNTFGSQVLYIDGWEIYSYKGNWPVLAVGDLVQITGEPSETVSHRLKIDDPTDIVVTGQQTPSVTDITTQDLSTLENGQLVRIDGMLFTRDGNLITLQDDAGEIIVQAHANSGINWNTFENPHLQITGIIRTVQGEKKLFPRSIEDVAEVTETVLEETEESALLGSLLATHDLPVDPEETMSSWSKIGMGLTAISVTTITYWFFKDKLTLPSFVQTLMHQQNAS